MDALEHAQQLISFDSVSCNSNVAITDYVEETLRRLGCEVERLEYEDEFNVPKANVVGKLGSGSGGMAYFGHTDVVPADDWFSDEHGPFTPTVVEDRLYGRGSCDMKGSVACALAAAERFAKRRLNQPLYIVCTSDEETGYGGAREISRRSVLFRQMVAGNTRGVIGEPTLLEVVYAHKGTYGFDAVSRGQSAHSSTSEGRNANLAMIPFLVEMKQIHDEAEGNPEWQNGEFDPPSISWNIGVNDHNYAVNIKAPQSVCTVYFRPMPGRSGKEFLEMAQAAADRHGLELNVKRCSEPLYVDPKSELIQETLQIAQRETPHTVAYGTDGGALTDLAQMVVIGPGSIAQAHTKDEWIALEQLEKGVDLYSRMIEKWCLSDA